MVTYRTALARQFLAHRFLALMAALPLSAGCLWTRFDELADETWVDSLEKPDGVAANQWGESFAEGIVGSSALGTTISVLSKGAAAITSLVYDEAGTHSFIKTEGAIGAGRFETAFLDHHHLAASPTSSLVAFAVATTPDTRANTKVIVIDAANNAAPQQFEPMAPSNMLAATLGSQGLTFGASDNELWVTRTNQIMKLEINPGGGNFVACALPDEAFAIAYADVDDDGTSDIVVASGANTDPLQPEAGRVWMLDPNTVTGNNIAALPTCGVRSGVPNSDALAVGAGSRLVVADLGSGPRVVLSTLGGNGKLTVLNFTAGTPLIESTIPAQGLASFAIGNVAPASLTPEFVIGLPLLGQVKVLTPTGEELMTLSETAAESGNRFGNSVAVMPFGANRSVLVVGKPGNDPEVFVYFRTSLYDDVRAGR